MFCILTQLQTVIVHILKYLFQGVLAFIVHLHFISSVKIAGIQSHNSMFFCSVLSTVVVVPWAFPCRWHSHRHNLTSLHTVCCRLPVDEVGERGVSWHHPHLQHREELQGSEALRHGDLWQPWKTRTGWDTQETDVTSKLSKHTTNVLKEQSHSKVL